MQNTLRKFFLTLGIVLFSQNVFADPPKDPHYLWRNTNYPSHYLLYDFATKTYVETVDCKPLWRFTIVSNEMNELTVFDASRGMTVKVNYDGMFLKEKGATKFTFYQKGTFDKRWQFSHHDAQGKYTGAITIQHACNVVEYLAGASGPSFKFKQTNRTNEYVDMYDASRDMLVRLTKDAMFLRTGHNPLAFFKNGTWNK